MPNYKRVRVRSCMGNPILDVRGYIVLVGVSLVVMQKSAPSKAGFTADLHSPAPPSLSRVVPSALCPVHKLPD